MDLRVLQHFLNLSDSLHFGRAAEASHISPSALSRSIQRLEGEVGALLFERNNRSVSLTAAGRLFLDYARNATDEWDAIRNTLMAAAGELRGEVSMFCSVTASYSFLFEILARFRRDHPRIEIKLHTGDPEEAIARVLAGDEDLSIGARPSRLPKGLAFRPIAVSPLVFIAAKDARLQDPGSGRQASAAEWAGTPMILPERGIGRSRADEWFRRLGLLPNIYAQIAGNEAIVSMVSLGFGIGIVPRIVLDNSPLADKVRVLEVRPELAPYEVGLFALEKRLASPLIGAFWSGTAEGP
ncbi:MAG TPA: HTH-type transcriptional activator IlvY [Xanthomonadales bacterium]|jgi:LysR family positive regulator for ilvC|nr:HTH-type transcriptional activator IlvY [Xanthomonadales bacterium]